MKKSILKTIYIFLFVSLFLGSITFYIQHTNKIDLNPTEEITINIIDDKVQCPENTDVAVLNYELNKFFSVCRLIMSVALPILYYLLFAKHLSSYEKSNKGYLKELSIFIISYTIFTTILTFPLSFFGGFYRTKIIGLTTMTLGTWALNYIKNIIINMLIGIILYYMPYRIYKASKRWYIYISALYVGFTIISAYITPAYIDPLFEEIVLLKNDEIKQYIDKLAEKANIDDLEVYVVKKGDKTKAINAYMTGIFNSKRIVLWDNTIDAISHEELMGVVAHEMGHYKLNHIEKSIGFSCIIMILLMCLFNLLIKKNKMDRNIKTLIVICIAFSISNVALRPIENYISRKMEYESDKYAIYLTNDKKSSAILEAKLMIKNAAVSDVSWWYKIMFCDHPTAKERIDAANQYVD